ncbi:branched-chain amino acid ABC transporter permease [Actinomadura sp. 3N508]|uniref:branched-chain amino acid ABC transporter permease n=1 Tax=Actinomadura sp. 3N508 TaxID=3375153 RepID=UPI0037A63CF9
MDNFLQLSFQGMALGCIYALIGLGFVMVFKSSGVFNFAHPVFVMISAYIVAALVPYGFGWGVLVALVCMVALAIVCEKVILRRLAGRSLYVVIMATLGLSVMGQAFVAMAWGVNPRGSTEGPMGRDVLRVGGVALSWTGVWIISVSLVLLAALWLFFQKTRHGLALRAAADHHEAALAQGINMRWVQTVSWGIAGVLAVAGGVFLGAFPRRVSPDMVDTALGALPALVIGGFNSLAGAVVGGMGVGLMLVLGSGYLAEYGGVHVVLPYVAMLLVLTLRPSGLFGHHEAERI